MKPHPHERSAGRRFRLMACVGLVAAVVALPGAVHAQFAPPSEGGKAVPSIPMSEFQPAASCDATLPWFGHQDSSYAAPQGTMAMTDGGWCPLQFVQVFNELYIMPKISVVAAPSHGEARAEQMPGRLAIVYRPVSGFVGTDHFAVRTDGPVAHTIPIDVTVR
jgi:hypothetical protein